MPFGSKEFTQTKDQEQKILDNLLSRVKDQLGLKVEIKSYEIAEPDSITKAYRIKLSDREALSCSLTLATDWDDTLERYTERKKLYFAKLIKLFSDQKTDLNKKELLNFFKLVNKTARCLPSDGTNPESYSPYLEILIESYCLEILKSRPEEFERILKLDKKELRQLIKNRIIPLSIKDMVDDIEKDKIENGKSVKKSYFQQLKPFVLEIDFKSKPPLVRQEIWDLFIRQMTGNNLSEESIAKMSLEEDIYWAISSFGSANFQLEKILSGLKELQANGQRLPDEIVIVTQGRKKPFLLKFFEELGVLGQKKILYLDDSKSQLDLMVDVKDKIKSVWALVRGSSRASKVKEVLTGEADHERVDLEKTSLQELVNSALIVQ